MALEVVLIHHQIRTEHTIQTMLGLLFLMGSLDEVGQVLMRPVVLQLAFALDFTVAFSAN